MSVMSAAEAGQTGDAGPDLPVPRRRLRVAAPAPDQDRGDGPESLFGPSSEAESGPDANAGGPWAAGTDVRTSEVRTSEVRSTELRVREVRVVRRARTVQRRAGAGPGQARAAQLQASEVTARIGTAAQVRAGYTRAASIPAQRIRPGMPVATRTRMAAQSSTVTRTQVVARTRTTRRSQRPGAIRLTRRGRLVVAGFAMLLVIVAATVLWMTAAASVQASSQGGTPASPYQGMTQVVVMPGQTLWSIAAAAEPSANTWTVVQQITEVNALSSTAVHAGQSLWVPKG